MAVVFKTRQFGLTGGDKSGLIKRRAIRGAIAGSVVPGVGTVTGGVLGAAAGVLSRRKYELSWKDSIGSSHSRLYKSMESAELSKTRLKNKYPHSTNFNIQKIY